MNFIQAIESGFRNFKGFSGRAARSEFWYFTLFIILLHLVLSLLDFWFFPAMRWGPLDTGFSLLMLLPSLAVSVRRLHDIGRTGWWVLLWFFPLIGAIVLIVFACQKGDEGPNEYGPDPLGAPQP